ncbi:MAG: GNAT family N-acetyltransferase, partial [Nocardioides sp.]
MQVESLAFRTDLALAELAGSLVEDHGSFVAIRTPGNPTYRWGNFLLLPRAPSAAELPDWQQTFARVLPGIEHRTFGIATAHGGLADLAPCAEAGFDIEAATVMTATAVHEPPRPNREATYRRLVSDADWEQQVGLRADEESDDSHEFVVAKVAGERRTVESGAGAWWGAFLGDRLVSSMGLVAASPGLARFQQVQTHP